LLRSYITGFRRSRTGCVMRDVCNCAPPSPARNISTFGKVGGSRRIMKGRVTEGTPWLWTLALGHHEDRTPTSGYAATREAAMAAFAKSWRRG